MGKMAHPIGRRKTSDASPLRGKGTANQQHRINDLHPFWKGIWYCQQALPKVSNVSLVGFMEPGELGSASYLDLSFLIDWSAYSSLFSRFRLATAASPPTQCVLCLPEREAAALTRTEAYRRYSHVGPQVQALLQPQSREQNERAAEAPKAGTGTALFPDERRRNKLCRSSQWGAWTAAKRRVRTRQAGRLQSRL